MSDAEKRTRDKESSVSSELNKNKKLNQSLEDKLKDYNKRLEYVDKKKAEAEKMHKSTGKKKATNNEKFIMNDAKNKEGKLQYIQKCILYLKLQPL